VRHSGLPLLSQLFQPQLKDNYLDISTGNKELQFPLKIRFLAIQFSISDEDGVWAIMGMAVDNNTVVMKFDPNSLEVF